MPNHVKLRLHADHAASCPGDGFYDADLHHHGHMVKGVLTATNITGRPAVNPKLFIREEATGHSREDGDDDYSRPADYEFPDLAHPGQIMNMHDPAFRQWSVPFVIQTWMAQSDGLGMQQHRRRGKNRQEQQILAPGRYKGQPIDPYAGYDGARPDGSAHADLSRRDGNSPRQQPPWWYSNDARHLWFPWW